MMEPNQFHISNRFVQPLALFVCMVTGQMFSVAHAQLIPLPPFYPFNAFSCENSGTCDKLSSGSSARSKSYGPKDGNPHDHAVVMGVDSNGDPQYSTVTGMGGGSAEAVAKMKCQKKGYTNCQDVYVAWDAAYLAIVKASDGGFYFVKGTSKSEAKSRGLAACGARANVTCEVVQILD
jgi:Domain of unknown function (DUF4189)